MHSLAIKEGGRQVDTIYSLTQHVARAYRVEPVAKDEIAWQQAQYAELIKTLGAVADKEFEAILAEGEPVEPGAQLDPELVTHIEANIAATRK